MEAEYKGKEGRAICRFHVSVAQCSVDSELTWGSVLARIHVSTSVWLGQLILLMHTAFLRNLACTWRLFDRAQLMVAAARRWNIR